MSAERDESTGTGQNPVILINSPAKASRAISVVTIATNTDNVTVDSESITQSIFDSDDETGGNTSLTDPIIDTKLNSESASNSKSKSKVVFTSTPPPSPPQSSTSEFDVAEMMIVETVIRYYQYLSQLLYYCSVVMIMTIFIQLYVIIFIGSYLFTITKECRHWKLSNPFSERNKQL